MARLQASGAVVAVLLMACGGGGGGGGEEECPPGSVLTIFPTSARVTAGGPAVSFGGGVSSCAADLTWQLAGPGSIDRSSGVPVSYTPPATVAALSTATLTASAAGQSKVAVITIDPANQLLTGHVIGGNGAPVAGAEVRVGTASATTDATGAFSLPGVTPPYELVAVAPGGLVASFYPELRRMDATLVLFDEAPGSLRSAHAAGALSGGAGFPVPGGHEAGVAFGALGLTASGPIQAGAAAFDLPVRWNAPSSSFTGFLHALQWQAEADGRPVAYDGHAGRANVTLLDGSTASGLDLALAAVGTGSVSGSLVEAGAPVSASLSLFAVLDGGARLRLLPPPRDPSDFPQVGFASTFSLATPVVAGATVDVVARKDYAGGAFQEAHRHGLATSAAGVALVFGGIPVQGHPPAGATVGVGPGMAFDWNSMAGNPVYVASFRGPPGSPSYDVFTMRQQIFVPPGVTIPVGVTYRWKVRASTAFATVDEAAGPGGYLAGAPAYLRAESGVWEFTTAP